MGSSSKKHKKEKKRKHKSRSRSPLETGVERERKHHRKHKKRDRSPDVEEVPVDSHLVANNGDALKDLTREEYARDRHVREEATRERASREDYAGRDDHTKERSSREDSRDYRESGKEKSSREDSGREISSTRESYVDKSPPPAPSNSESLSIEETNRIRAKLGLKPLQMEEERAEDGKLKDDLGEFYHAPAANLNEQRRTEKLKQKLQDRKEKRQLEQRFLTGSLAEGSDDEDASAWVNKNRQITKQKADAAKRAAMLDEMDAVFGVGALVEEEEREERSQRYTANQLKGLRVAHDTDNLTEGREVVLTLADKNLLDEDAEDVLINVNMVDDDKYKKNIEDRKKAKSGYQAYEEADDIEAAALGMSRPVLAKYDEEIDNGAAARKAKGFVIGDEDGAEAKRFRQMMVKARLAGEAGGKRLESLKLPELQIASDYLSEAELNAKFKKPKRKGKIRKKAKSEPIDVDEYDPSNAPLETDDTEVDLDELRNEEGAEELEPDSELQTALARARRLRQLELLPPKLPKVEEMLERVKEEADEEPETEEAGAAHMVLDATAEFCRTLGDIPTYGLAGNRDSHLEIMDFEREETAPEPEEAEATGAWSRVDVEADKPPDITAGGSGSALEAEPALGAGVGGALKLALSKGYLERQAAGAAPRASNTHHLLTARHYSIDDKAHGEEDKFSRRGQDRYSGPLQDFREKSNFRPDVKLDYVDDEGRPLCPKEAFRYLSHKFHGKGPGKNKQEKRIKKSVQEGLMKKMSSTDTPLGTLAMLQGKQKETQSPYVVLSGTKREPNH